MPKNSNIILARGIRVDKDYNNVCDANMLSVVQGSAAATASNYSFIRRNRSLKANFAYGTAITCNYMAFQNPDYSNKWFFAWIDNVEYVGENTIEIDFTIDNFSTWFNDITKTAVYVDREHVSSDTYGLHTLPEPVRPDLMISQNVTNDFYNSFYIVVYWLPAQITVGAFTPYNLNQRYYSSVRANIYPCSSAGIMLLESDLIYTGELGNASIIAINLIPEDFLDDTTNKHLIGDHAVINRTISKTRPTALNGYIPVNNKCLLYPYTYLTVNNGNTEKIYKYEKFANLAATGAIFNISGAAVPNGAITIYPMNYDGITGGNPSESLSLGDLPMMPFSSDSYAAWLAQKSSGTQMQGIMATLTGALAGGLHGGAAGAAIGAGAGLVGSLSNVQTAEEFARSENDRVIGTNNVDMDMIRGLMGFTIAQKSVVADDAERLDRFLSQYGYNISMVKQPNYTGRQYWNYVKINGSCGYGNVPESAREEINRILNNGTTIWHSHNNIGNYFIGGNKMQNPII